MHREGIGEYHLVFDAVYSHHICFNPLDLLSGVYLKEVLRSFLYVAPSVSSSIKQKYFTLFLPVHKKIIKGSFFKFAFTNV